MKKITVEGLLLCSWASMGSALFPAAVLADYRQYYGWGPGMMGWWGPMSWFGPVGMILFWALLVLLIILLIRGLRSGKVIGRERGAPAESALDILKKRYARGEINKEEYLEKKKELEGI